MLLDRANDRKQVYIETLKYLLVELDKYAPRLSAERREQVAQLLTLFTDKSYYRSMPELWQACSMFARANDPKSADEFEAFFTATEHVRNRLPTRALMVLRIAHDVLAEEKCCMSDKARMMTDLSPKLYTLVF